jgi:hypothetical protein
VHFGHGRTLSLQTSCAATTVGRASIQQPNEWLDVQLTPADVAALDGEFSKVTVHGGRMNEMQLRAVERAS